MRSQTVPGVTIALIAANLLVFFREIAMGPRGLEAFLLSWGFVPSRFFEALTGQSSVLPALLTLVSSLFLHGGWTHVIGNMWYLWIFGDNVEDRLGHAGYFAFYLACGVAAGLAHAFAQPGAVLPAVGASGAIAGVLGAYLVLYPRGTVLTLLPLFVFFTTVEIRAFWFLIFWFVLQSFSGVAELARTADMASGGVAWWAHIGGFLAGAGLALVLRVAGPSGRRRRG